MSDLDADLDVDLDLDMSLEISDLDMELAEISLVPDLRKCAILLDIDGTILDLAPSPQQVWGPPGLRRTLARLVDLTGGAVALVSGRSPAHIDLIFSPLQPAAIRGPGAGARARTQSRPSRCSALFRNSAAWAFPSAAFLPTPTGTSTSRTPCAPGLPASRPKA